MTFFLRFQFGFGMPNYLSLGLWQVFIGFLAKYNAGHNKVSSHIQNQFLPAKFLNMIKSLS